MSEVIVWSGWASVDAVTGNVTCDDIAGNMQVSHGEAVRYWKNVRVPINAAICLTLTATFSGESIFVNIRDGQIDIDPEKEEGCQAMGSLVFKDIS